MVMRRRIVLGRQMARGAEGVSLRAEFLCVRLMAVAAGHSGVIHAALEERSPDVDFVALLAVGKIQLRREERRAVEIEERQSGMIAIFDLTAPGMTLRTDVNFGVT